MFDTMTLTKIVGSFCGALLIFLLGSWAAEEIYHVGGGHGGDHDGEEITQAYSIPVEEDEPANDEPEVSFDEVFASADPGAGERVFGKCRACHNIDGSDAVGPHLNGVVGREIGSVGGFNYSGNLSDQGADAWSPDVLNAFLLKPQDWAPGTTMSFNGLPKIEDRANLIAYLDTLGS